MLKVGDTVDYKGSLYIVDFEESGWLKMDWIRDKTKSIVFNNYNDFVDDLQLVVGGRRFPVKPNLVFDKIIKKHML